DRLPNLLITGLAEDPNQVESPATVELRDGREARFRHIAAEGGPPGSMAKSTRSGSMSGPRPRANEIASANSGLARASGGFAGGTMGGGGAGMFPPGGSLGGAQRADQPASMARGAGAAGAESAQLRARFQLAEGNLERRPLQFQLEDQSARASVYVPNAESYSALIENPFHTPTEYPLSTFSIDVDTASYTNVRRFLNARALPPADAVRVEELMNYFQYAYPQPEGDRPFSVTTDVADCPWNAEHRLLRVGLKGREVAAETRPAGNLVFLLDVSGSMQAANKLPLVKEAMSLLTEKLTENDRVAMVTYAGESGLALPPTNGTDKAAIHAAIDRLSAGGSTNGGQGLQMAYDTAQSQFIKGGVNRVILATDGDFNVGIVNQDDLVNLVADKAKNGVYLTALGFGMGNLKDGTLEKLADKGNGNYAYIDTLAEARRVLVEQLSGTLVTIAKDVKLRIEFNPAQAAEYRLIGYENRLMPPQDFHDDRKDAGEIGAGHTVTALYEIVPAAGAAPEGDRQLKYQPARPRSAATQPGELATIQLRYKDPEATESRLIEQVVTDQRPRDAASNADFQFAAAVAEFGMLLRNSPYRGAASYKSVLALAEQGLGNDAHGYRAQFIELVRQARELAGEQ
ncbi:MAG TPA: VWA domain-containing protein, partial [Pirellulales bacterium]